MSDRKRDERRRAFNAVVNKLTNWQRGKWARAGYPGLARWEGMKVEPFALLSCEWRDVR